MFAFEHSGVVPDVLVVAKGLASGYPLSVVVTRKELSDLQLPGSMGGTYGGNAVCVAAALGTLDVFDAENVLGNVQARGAQLMNGLRDIAGGIAASGRGAIKDVRGVGLMVAVEFDPHDTGVAGALSAACLGQYIHTHIYIYIYSCTRLINVCTLVCLPRTRQQLPSPQVSLR